MAVLTTVAVQMRGTDESLIHYFVGATYDSERIDSKRMTICQQLDYTKGYNETPFAQKDWGTFE